MWQHDLSVDVRGARLLPAPARHATKRIISKFEDAMASIVVAHQSLIWVIRDRNGAPASCLLSSPIANIQRTSREVQFVPTVVIGVTRSDLSCQRGFRRYF